MRFFKKNILTKLTSLLILTFVLSTIFTQEKWEKDNGVLKADVRGYYAYLPALIVNGDLTFEDLSIYDSHLGSLVWVSENEEGTRFIKYTCGMSILYSPFFMVAHSVAEAMGYPADGFSKPYIFAIVMSSVFYLIMALIFLSSFLLMHFKDSVVAVVLLTLFLGTNAFHYYTGDMAYSHGYSLAMISMFLYGAAKWLTTLKIRWAILTGIAAGIFVLIRPIDILFLLFLPLYGVSSIQDVKSRFVLFWKKKVHIIIMILFFALMLLPQFVYFKYISGSFLFYSYTGESFFFSNPHLYDILFSYRNGWLVYSPIMLFSLLGMFFMWRKKEKLGLFTVITFAIYFYVIASWWCWWYVGFGNRAFINLYPLLSVPLAYFIQYIFSRHWIQKTTLKLLIFGAIFLTQFQERQFEHGTLHWGAMTEEAYWDSFGNEYPSQLLSTYLRYPVSELALEGVDAVHDLIVDTVATRFVSFDKIELSDSVYRPNIQSELTRRGNGALYYEGIDYSPHFTIPIEKAQRMHTEIWVKSESEVRVVVSKNLPAVIFNATKDPQEYDGDWYRLNLYTTISPDLEVDSIDIYLWNESVTPFWVDDLKVTWTNESFEIKKL